MFDKLKNSKTEDTALIFKELFIKIIITILAILVVIFDNLIIEILLLFGIGVLFQIRQNLAVIFYNELY